MTERTPAPPASLLWSRLVPAVAAGGALGGVARWGLDLLAPTTTGEFPWTMFAINVAGAAALAALPLLGVVRRGQVLLVFLGTGVLGGFTSMSAASEQTAALLRGGDALLGLGYAGATLAAALAAVALVSSFTPESTRRAFAGMDADE